MTRMITISRGAAWKRCPRLYLGWKKDRNGKFYGLRKRESVAIMNKVNKLEDNIT